MPTTILKKLIHVNIETIASKVNKCTVCPCTKQKRLPFHVLSNTMDLWGPYKIAIIDGNRYF